MRSFNADTYVGASFSLSNRLARLGWAGVYALLLAHSPRPLHSWRSAWLRLFGANVGRGVHVYPKARIWAPWNVILHDECGVADRAILYSQDVIELGYRSIVSQGAHFCTGTHDYEASGHRLVTSPIRIGAYAWIAAEAFILPGVTIGEGCVVGARAVVTQDMPPWAVCAGHPCRVIKDRKWRPDIS